MWKNYLKIALRNSWKRKTFSLINILGLALGMTCCFLILQYVGHEQSYDNFHTNKERLYRLNYQFGDRFLSRCPPTLGPALGKNIPEIEAITRLYPRDISIGLPEKNNAFESTATFFADSSTTRVFDFDFIAGEEKTALHRPYSVVLTQSMAQRLFGKTEVLGENVKIGADQNYKITGVIKDWPSNTHLDIEALIHFYNMIDLEPVHAQEALTNILAGNKTATHSFTYALLQKNTQAEKVNQKIAAFHDTFGQEELKKDQAFTLGPIADIHLHSPADTGNSATLLYLFVAIGFIILLIACINFINLTTASSISRAKEVGVRKVLGAKRSFLIGQFLGESLLLCFFAYLIALALGKLAMPYLNALTDLELTFAPWQDPKLLAIYTGIFLITGFLAGAYPAFFVSKFQAATAIKGALRNTQNPGGVNVRKLLVTLQFLVAISFISGAAIVYLQVNFLRNQPIGFAKDLFLSVPIDNRSNINAVFRSGDAGLRQKMNTLDDLLTKNPNVIAVTQCSSQPGFGAVGRKASTAKIKMEDNFFPRVISVDYDYRETLGLETLAGRDFDVSYGTDHLGNFLINETAAKAMQFKNPEEAIGEKLTLEYTDGQIIGVVKDFHFSSLRSEIEPLILEVRPGAFQYYGIRISNNDIPETIAFLESQWGDFFPGKVFEYFFLDETINEAYQQEGQLTQLIAYFAFIAIFISCFGLFGLSVLVTQQRYKEIGIRKILGASISQILNLLSIDFLKLIAVAMILAIPLTWYFLNAWMSEFAYRIDFPWWVPLLTGLGVLTLAFLTITSQTVKVASANPADALRQE